MSILIICILRCSIPHGFEVLSPFSPSYIVQKLNLKTEVKRDVKYNIKSSVFCNVISSKCLFQNLRGARVASLSIFV